VGVPDTVGVIKKLQLGLRVTVAPVPDRVSVVRVGRGGDWVAVWCTLQDDEVVTVGEGGVVAVPVVLLVRD